MKRYLPLLAGTALLFALAACKSKPAPVVAPDGKSQMTMAADGKEWTITDTNGHELVSDYDSMVVVEQHPNGQPMIFYYAKGVKRYYYHYYQNMTMRAQGVMVDGKRQGRWVFYHPNGLPQCEANYDVDGKEDGLYTVYRDNGVPYYRGYYEHGKRTGNWEAYNTDGTLSDTKTY